MLKRMFAYFTVLSYLIVGTVAIRMYMPEMKTVEISSSYFNLFSNTEEKEVSLIPTAAPVIAFQKIKFPVEKKVVKVAKAVFKLPPPRLITKSSVVAFEFKSPTRNELPFHDPIVLTPVQTTTELNTNIVSVYREFKYEAIAEAVKPVEDSVSTKLAASESPTAEPEFFEYPEVKEEKKTEETPAIVAASEVTQEKVETVEPTESDEKVASPNTAVEEISVNELVTFDYSKAQQDVEKKVIPQVSVVTTQNLAAAAAPQKTNPPQMTMTHPKNNRVTTQQPVQLPPSPLKENKENQEDGGNEKGLLLPKTYHNKLTIQITGTNLNEQRSETGFEVRFQDDHSEVFQDYNSGTVQYEQILSAPKMTRSAVILKRGYAPTNIDLILEEGRPDFSVPLIEEGKFNELLAPYESRGPMGAVLVELEDGVETAFLDVPYSQVIKLDEDMRVTDDKEPSYQLFVGVKAGNSLLSYRDSRGLEISKIIHIHERELTFDMNIFEDVDSEVVSIKEEDLLSKEKAPLILTTEQIRHFASNRAIKKVNNHTYKTDFEKTLLGARKYLELGHLPESIFVGYKDSKTLDVPSENLIQYVLSKFENSKLGQRCLVQINLPKKAVDVKVGTESAGESLVAYTQVLDTDGRFYDSVSKKSRKILVVGENQGSSDYSKDSKINIKITYEDDTVQYLGSYCSPNTYLVEQL